MTQRILRGVFYAPLLGAAIVFAGLVSLRVATHGRGTVEVPNLFNKSLNEALTILAEADLELRKADERYSDSIPESHILRQDPLPGTVVRRGRPVRVVVSKGHRFARVPNVTGRALRVGRIALVQDGFKSGHISWVHNQADENVILAQSPAAGGSAVRDSPVDLLVSLGPRKNAYRMPSLLGKRIDNVTTMLTVLGLEVGDVETTVNPALPQGQILAQDPVAGARIVEGDTVKLTMSVPTPVGREAEINFGVVVFRPSPGFFKRQIRVEVIDNQGAREVYRQMHFPAEEVMVPYQYRPPATVKVFQDNELVLERVHE